VGGAIKIAREHAKKSAKLVESHGEITTNALDKYSEAMLESVVNLYTHNFENNKIEQHFASSAERTNFSNNIMSLARFRPFALRTPLGEVFDMPAFPFPRELANFPSFNSFDNNEGFWHSRHPYQVHEDDKMYTVSVDVPGVRAEVMNIKIDNNVLHLSGGRKIQDGKNVSERKFEYRMTLGDDVQMDKISANLADGVLKLTAPKVEVKKPEARTIQITEGPAPKQLHVEKK
jgi:HSP20 family molecular chaperone IbpA